MRQVKIFFGVPFYMREVYTQENFSKAKLNPKNNPPKIYQYNRPNPGN
jgi:hypothetical protein